jgi:hypothetical protein
MNITRWLRIIHRDLGFLVVGISLVYAVSGIYLNHLHGSDPAFKTEERTLQLAPSLSADELAAAWNAAADVPPLKKIAAVDEGHLRLMLDGGIGVYSRADGRLDYETHRRRFLVYWINRLHYSRVQGWNIVADVFAASLIFLALSGLFIVKGKRGLAGSGKWWLIAGLAIPIAYVALTYL